MSSTRIFVRVPSRLKLTIGQRNGLRSFMKIISSGLLSIIIFGTLSIIYLNTSVLGQPINNNDSVPAKPNTIQDSVISNVPTRKVHVGDIDIGYKIFGKGDPILLITGANGVRMDVWDPVLLRELASNHTVIIFDNRGVGNTTSGFKVFSIKQFANDTSGLLDALNIKKPVDVLGWSMGSFVAQELAILHPDKVNKLILYASSCSGKQSVPPSPKAVTFFTKNVTRITSNGNARFEASASLLFPKTWIKENPNYLQYLPKSKESASIQTILGQILAMSTRTDSCNQLSRITKPTLVIDGTSDIITPSANSLLIAEKIPGAWLVQINGAGHGLMYQYPQKFSKIVKTFLEEG
jgi:pimeloyl-ACP methyl ester carboxylesterase